MPAYIQTASHLSQSQISSITAIAKPKPPALHELDDDHVFLTSARCKWHSDPNFWGEMEWKRFVWCPSRLVGASLPIRHECAECQACEGSLAWMLYWNNAYLHPELFNNSRICSAHYLASQSPCWRNKPSHAPSSLQKLAGNWCDAWSDLHL